MRNSKRFAILVPLVSIVSALALSARAEEPKGPPHSAPQHTGPAVRPNGAALHPGPGPGPGPGRSGPVASGRSGPVGSGQRFAHGPMPSRNFGGHAYHGHLAWEGGRWHHAVRNGRDGWWWDVGGAWYFYPQMVEGPPTYVSDVEYADDAYAPDGPPVADGYAPPPVEAYPPPPPPPGPPDAASGAVGGAVLGGILGGVLTGRPGGAVAGAIVGGTTGALVGAQAAARQGYWLSQGGCYYRYPNGQYVPVDPRSCY
jgi:hypothetical protein